MKTGCRTTSAIVARGCKRTPVTRRIKISFVCEYEEGRVFVSSHPPKLLNTRDFVFQTALPSLTRRAGFYGFGIHFASRLIRAISQAVPGTVSPDWQSTQTRTF